MNILDENIGQDQREKLRRYKIRFRHIGTDIAATGIDDKEQVLPLLHSLRDATFFTGDRDFYRADWRHERYALVYLKTSTKSIADVIRSFLKNPNFNTAKKRMGKVIRIGDGAITILAK